MDIKDCIIYEKTIPAHPAVYDDFPENLLPELAEYLKSHGIGKLYCHQTEMFEKVTSGKNVVITTSTASGKTLSFLLPVLQDILKNPLTKVTVIKFSLIISSFLGKFGLFRYKALHIFHI